MISKQEMDDVYMPFIDKLNNETLYNRVSTVEALCKEYGIANQ
jgi:hypothetical protein